MITFRKLSTAALVALSFAGVALAGPIAFTVVVDTSAISPQAGLLDFQFNPGPTDPVQAANVTIMGYTGDTLGLVLPSFGDVTGTLGGPNSVFIDNGVLVIPVSPLNDYAQNVTYGAYIAYRLIFDGPAIEAPDNGSGSPSTFAFYMYSYDGDGNLVAVPFADPTGLALTIDIDHQGMATATGSADFLTADVAPEPSTLLLVGVVLAAAGLWRARRREATRTGTLRCR